MMKRPAARALCVLFVFLAMASCAQSRASTSVPATPTSRTTPAPTASRGTPAPTASPQSKLYTDAKLGFRLAVPLQWQAEPQPGSQASHSTSAVTFSVHGQKSQALILIGVFQGSQMPAAFAARGTPTAHIGSYPAFVANIPADQARAPCLVRIFLAGNDYVLADWCAPDALASRAQFEQMLATYRPALPTFAAARTAAPVPAPAPQTCAGMQNQLGIPHAQGGRELATPAATGWHAERSGAFVCSNDGSSNWYLFQCTELANRFLYERWALPHIPGRAAHYFDYYLGGVYHPGTVRTFPAGTYQLSNDASQGKSAFRPVAGDLLIFQDVHNARQGWTSGLTNSPGHVAVIVGVDDTTVYVAQENYSDAQYFMALPIHRVADGYEITDLSGWSQRIVRGWIHFTVNGGETPLLT
jgi:CHAP domain